MQSDVDSLPDLSKKSATWLLALGVVVAVVTFLMSIGWGLPPDRTTWAGDEIRPSAVVHPERWPRLYPPGHRYVLGAVFEGVTFVQRQLSLKPAAGEAFWILVSRYVTVAIAGLCLVVIYRCGRRVLGRAESLLAVVCVGFGAGFVYYAKTANLDIPYLLWYISATLFFLRSLQTRRLADYILFAIFGALSIATKTQAWALYLLPAGALVLDLYRAQPRGSRSLLRALVDRRILAAAAATVFVTLLAFGELTGNGELLTHLHAIRGRPYEDYRAYVPAGATVLKVSFQNLVLDMGVPALLAALAGIGMALRRPAANGPLLYLLLFPLSYYPAFILATGFNYERHYLPITVVLGLFAGKGLGALLKGDSSFRTLRAALIGLVVVHSLLRGLSVDLMLRGDARYEAERWLAEQHLGNQVVGLGSERDLPRGVTTHPRKKFARWTRGEHSHNPRIWHNCVVLDRLGAEYLIPDFGEELAGPGVNYREYLRFRNQSRLRVVDFNAFSRYHTTLAKVARDVVVFKRTDGDCVDRGFLPRGFHELRYRRDPDRRRRLALAVLDSPVSNAVDLPHSDYRVARVQGDFWTFGTIPAGVAVRNRGRRAYSPRLTLGLAQEGVPFPVRVFIEDGLATREERFEGPDVRSIVLGAIDPEEVRLYIVWTDRSWRGRDSKLRGVRLSSGESRGDWLNRMFEQRLDPDFYATLSLFASDRRSEKREAFVDAVVDGRSEGATRVDRGSHILVGGWPDGWSYDDRPVGLVIRNASDRIVRPRLLLGCESSGDGPPRSVSIGDGRKVSRLPLDCGKTGRFQLPRLAPGQRRLYVLWTEEPPVESAVDRRSRGIQVKGVKLIPKKIHRDSPEQDPRSRESAN